jgi:hypothetical protein
MRKWEYRVRTLNLGPYRDWTPTRGQREMDEELAQIGDEGWEIVPLGWYDEQAETMWVLLKREKA